MSALAIPDDLLKAIKALEFTRTPEGLRFTVKGGQLTVAKLLVRHFKLNDKYKDDQIRDLADSIELKLNPPDLWYPETPQDYTLMYSCGASCMSYPILSCYKGQYDSKLCYEILDKYGLWSSIWYCYNPFMQGVCLMKEKKPVARGFIFPEHGYFGGAYGNSPVDKDALYKKLPEISPPFKMPLGILRDFRMPALELPHGLYGALPKGDSMGNPIHVAFDTKTNEFIFSNYSRNPTWKLSQNCRPPGEHQWMSSKLATQV